MARIIQFTILVYPDTIHGDQMERDYWLDVDQFESCADDEHARPVLRTKSGDFYTLADKDGSRSASEVAQQIIRARHPNTPGGV